MRDFKMIDIWKSVSPEQWNDWNWQIRNRITTTEQLEKLVNLPNEEKQDIDSCLEKFKMAITPYYSTLIEPENDKCPVRMQSIPSKKELSHHAFELLDPLNEEAESPVNNVIHRYPDRVLFLLTHRCSMYCRHCTRRRVVGQEDFTLGEKEIENAINYIKGNTAIRDVLLSGGDPFVLQDAFLERIISQLRNISHVEIIRIGTRTPVVLPMRITDGLLSMLKKYHPIWINTHFNHPNEITEDSAIACRKIADAGIPLGNQTVLLKGVNDRADVLKDLFTNLVKNRVRPYYLYQCDLSVGLGHFRTNVEVGMDIMKNLRGFISGFAIPTFVIDAPKGGGKIPINPEYIVDMDAEKVIMKNYKDEIYVYPNVW